jgi:hypothetical protein
MEASCIAAQQVGSDEATYYLSNKINQHNTEAWEFQNFHPVTVPEQNSPQMNVVCAISQHKTNGPCFFKEKLINDNIYPDMLTGLSLNFIKTPLPAGHSTSLISSQSAITTATG